MSDEHREPNSPKPERKPPIVGANIVWYLIALCAATLFLVSWMEPGTQAELGYMDLVKLIEQGAPAKNPKAAIEVREPEGKEQQLVRYSNLDELKIGPSEITGTVTRQVIEPKAESGKAEPKVSFHTGRMGLENDNNFLFKLLEGKGFTNVRAKTAPASGPASSRRSS